MNAGQKIVVFPFAVFLLGILMARAENEPAETPAPKAGVIIDATAHIDPAKGHWGIQDAIDAAHEAGGGTVVLPEGEFALKRYLQMRSHVTLKGQGEKTILTLAPPPGYAWAESQEKENTAIVRAKGNLNAIRPGTPVTIYHYGEHSHPRPHLDPGHHYQWRARTRVKAIDGDTVIFEDDPGVCRQIGSRKGREFFGWGLVTRLKKPVSKGDKVIHVENPEWLERQRGLYITGEGDLWNFHFNAVVEIDGDAVTLERPITVEAAEGSDVTMMHSAIAGDHDPETKERLTDVTIRDLVIDGRARELNMPRQDFMVAGIAMTRTDNLTIRNVTVKNWPSDGFSMQSQSNLLVEDSHALHNSWTGFHPGTGVRRGLFFRVTAIGNGHTGLFYCFGNYRVDLKDSVFSDNDGDGIGGLGHGAPPNTMNTVENCIIERNGRYGVQLIGGGKTGNVIRNSIVRDNSRLAPGIWRGPLPGIGIIGQASATIEGCTIESTLENPTQLVGIEESHNIRTPRAKAGETLEDTRPQVVALANNNRIINNTVRGHKTADIIVRGPDTVIDGNTGNIIEERRGLGPVNDDE